MVTSFLDWRKSSVYQYYVCGGSAVFATSRSNATSANCTKLTIPSDDSLYIPNMHYAKQHDREAGRNSRKRMGRSQHAHWQRTTKDS